MLIMLSMLMVAMMMVLIIVMMIMVTMTIIFVMMIMVLSVISFMFISNTQDLATLWSVNQRCQSTSYSITNFHRLSFLIY